jgi:hypothetical protein
LQRDLTLAARSGAGSLEGFYDLPEAEEWIALWQIEQETCPYHHGPRSECGDTERDHFPQRVICWPEAQLLAAKRLFDLLHEKEPFHDGAFLIWSDKPSKLTPFRYDDGTRFYMAPIDEAPWDKWPTEKYASPDKPQDWDESVETSE